MKKHNLHVHTTFSDGNFTLSQIIELAKRTDLEILGISDHAYTSKTTSLSSEEEIEHYLRSIRSQSKNYSGLKAGLEIDFRRLSGGMFPKLHFSVINQLDYLLFEYLGTQEGDTSIDELLRIRSNIQIPIGLAHTDLQINYAGKESEIAKILSDNNIFLELNHSDRNSREGMPYYMHFSRLLLENLVKYKVNVVIGTDLHEEIDINNVQSAMSFITENKLQYSPLVL